MIVFIRMMRKRKADVAKEEEEEEEEEEEDYLLSSSASAHFSGTHSGRKRPPFSAEMNSSEFNSTNGNETRHITPDTKQLIFIDDTSLFYGYPVVVPLSIIIILIIILAIGGNIMVIITILRHRGMRTRTNMFIVNLAVADILVAAMDMPVSLITILKGRWVFGHTLCQLNAFTMALFLICSIHTLMYISVHKYISITRPFSRAMTPRRIKMMIVASWMWAMFCAIGPLIGWNKNEYKMGASQCGPAIPMGLKEKSHSALITISNYAIPLAIMIFCYSRIFREIHVHMQRIRKTSNIDLENSVAQQKKVAITLFWVLACFLLCWTPFVLYSNAAVFIRDKSKLPPILNPLAYWCGYLNSACNPIIYAFRSPSFRKGYKEIMCGTAATNLSTANSLSFRSRSARGSMKYAPNMRCQLPEEKRPEVTRQHTMLSQTSWRSLPLIRTLSRKKIERDSSTETSTDCIFCGFWKPRTTSSPYTSNDEHAQEGDRCENVPNAQDEETGHQTVTFNEEVIENI